MNSTNALLNRKLTLVSNLESFFLRFERQNEQRSMAGREQGQSLDSLSEWLARTTLRVAIVAM